MPPGSPAPCAPQSVPLSQLMNRDNRQLSRACALSLSPTQPPPPRQGEHLGPVGEELETTCREGREDPPPHTRPGGGQSQVPPPGPDKRRANASLLAATSAARPSPAAAWRRVRMPGAGTVLAGPCAPAEAMRPPAPRGPSWSPLHSARASPRPPPLTFPHSPPHGPETQKVCFSWLCAPLRQLRPRPSGWAPRRLSLSLSLSSSFFPFSAFFSSNSPL